MVRFWTRRDWWFRFIAVTGGVILGMACAEAGLRLRLARSARHFTTYRLTEATPRENPCAALYLPANWPGLQYTFRPNLDLKCDDRRLCTDGDGWVVPCAAAPATPAGGTPLIIVGDSVETGWRTPAERAWPWLLARRVGRPVVNAAVYGYNLVQKASALERVLMHLDQAGRLRFGDAPPIVMVGVGGNDEYPAQFVPQLAAEQFVPRGCGFKLWCWFFPPAKFDHAGGRGYSPYDWIPAYRRGRVQSGVERIVAATQQRGIPLAFVYTSPRLRRTFDEYGLQLLRRYAAGSGAVIVSNSGAWHDSVHRWQRLHDRDFWSGDGDNHPNAAGHRVLAAAAERAYEALGGVPTVAARPDDQPSIE